MVKKVSQSQDLYYCMEIFSNFTKYLVYRESITKFLLCGYGYSSSGEITSSVIGATKFYYKAVADKKEAATRIFLPYSKRTI